MMLRKEMNLGEIRQHMWMTLSWHIWVLIKVLLAACCLLLKEVFYIIELICGFVG